ncbi:hypothetical protein P9VFCI_104 [Rhizobium phage P9VFCI]|uniref:Transmembrane protein n=1 Tax=Rhizobium phage P9VFCI TaxID=2763531 RepID=A0A7G7WXR6_9CAUD|nr:hypothetical protein PP937_gp104 [Rhizobium phage P9VFCI]QNH72010.1 hypothetical protein P9VFCI_104 [Rhizobium phage P9VFCI]
MKALYVAAIGILIGVSAIYGKDISLLEKILTVYAAGAITPFIWFTYHFFTDQDVRYVEYKTNF